jgi:hypothetical protein
MDFKSYDDWKLFEIENHLLKHQVRKHVMYAAKILGFQLNLDLAVRLFFELVAVILRGVLVLLQLLLVLVVHSLQVVQLALVAVVLAVLVAIIQVVVFDELVD